MVWDEAARDDDLIVKHLESSESAGIDNELEVVRARARAVASHINRDLAYANLQAVMARLYNSVGYDVVPREEEERELTELTKLVQARYGELERASFSPRAQPERPVAAVGEIKGVAPRVAKLIAEGAQRVLSAGQDKPAGAAADVWLDLQVKVERSREGRRAVRVDATTRRAAGIAAPQAREFKSTLSDPVEDEQWRTLGEAAAYRLAGDLATTRITRPVLRLEPALAERTAAAPATPAASRASAEPLDLRLEERIAPR
jgi:hypothetical protein